MDAAASPIAREIAGRLGARRKVSFAYPGIWLRDDVWATHGHYLDRLITIPTFERIAAGGMARVVGRLPEPGEGSVAPEDFEAALAPMYAWLDQLANGRAAGGRWASGAATAKAWSLLSADGRAPLRGKALAALLPLGIAGINLAGLGPVRAKIDSDELRRAGIAAMGGVVRLLGVQSAYVVFGHTHCAGPLAWMDPGEWRVHGGTNSDEHRLLDGRAAHQHARPALALPAGLRRARRGRGTAAARADHREPRRAPRSHVLSAPRRGPARSRSRGSRARRAAPARAPR